MFPSARAQWLSQLSSRRWRSKDNCQVSFSGELVIFGHSCPDKWGYVDDCFHFCCVFTMMCMTDRGSPARFLSIFKPLGQNPSINDSFHGKKSARCNNLEMTQTWIEDFSANWICQSGVEPSFSGRVKKNVCKKTDGMREIISPIAFIKRL